jgi:hypothetical protein
MEGSGGLSMCKAVFEASYWVCLVPLLSPDGHFTL